MRLHHRPQILGREITEHAALPLAVIALDESRIDQHFRRPNLAIEDELGRLLTTLKRARHDSDYGDGCEPFSGQSPLVASDLVQIDALRPPSQQSSGICCGAAVSHENNCRHVTSLVTHVMRV
ncbi:hypothetical protein GCM10025779_07030 [Arthrobacter cryoconiti]